MNEDQMLENVLKLSAVVDNQTIKEYMHSQLPNQNDETITQIVDEMMILDPDEREAFMSLLDDDSGWVLSIYSTRMAMFGVRQGSQAYLVRGLVALSYAVSQNGYRET